MEENNNSENNNTERKDKAAEESNAARRIRMLGESSDNVSDEYDEEPLKINKWSNFWYHNKWKVIIIAAFAFVLGTAAIQFANQSNPDVSLLYAGPVYITPNENKKFCSAIESIMDDYNGDGKKYVQLNDLIFMTEDQIERILDEAEENDEDVVIDRLSNSQVSERFTYEVFGGEASICILAEDQYKTVLAEGGFMKLSEIFTDDNIPDSAIDDYGLRVHDMKFYKFYADDEMFPEDAVIALRTVSTMSALTGRKKALRLHDYSKDLFIKLAEFEYPAGYTE